MGAPDFNKIIQDGRERKANEKLASQIFSRNRRQSAPSKLSKLPATAPTLASRISKKPQRISLGSRATTAPAPVPSKGNINNDWTHDLHHSVSSPNLASRITSTATGPATSKRAARRQQKNLANALSSPSLSAQANIIQTPPAATASSFSIRGLAGPFCVMAQNFARGTTAADVESAMTPVGGQMESCKIVKTEPFILVEMMFASKEGGERVIETFNNQTADGRVIKVWAKIGGPGTPSGPRSSLATTSTNTQNQPRGNNKNNNSSTADQFVDGKMGFEDPMQRDQRGLYSDKMVSNGRGRGGRGRGRR